MDATPVTLGQEFGGYATQVELGIERLRGVAAPAGRAAARRHRRRHRHQHPQGLLRRGHQGGRPRDQAAADRGARPLRGPGRPRRPGRGLGPAAHDRGRALQDLQRPALDGLRARAPASARSALPDLQPGSTIMPGKVNPVIPEALCMVVRPGDRQRRRDRVRRRGRQLRAQHHAADAGPQPARVDPVAQPTSPGCWPTGSSTASRPTSSAPASTPRARPRSSPRSTATSATRTRPRSPSSRWPSGGPSARSCSSTATSRPACSPRRSSTPPSTCSP